MPCSKFGIGATELEVGGQAHILIREDDLIGIMPSSNATADGAPVLGQPGRRSKARPGNARVRTPPMPPMPMRSAARCSFRQPTGCSGPVRCPAPLVPPARPACQSRRNWPPGFTALPTCSRASPVALPLQTSRSCALWATAC